jgi:hypothetical protein
VAVGPVPPGVKRVEDASDSVQLEPVEVVEVAARSGRVGGFTEAAGSEGELIEEAFHGCAARLGVPDIGFGVVDGVSGVGLPVAGRPAPADPGEFGVVPVATVRGTVPGVG